MLQISFQGEHGAYSEQAITSFLKSNSIEDYKTIPCMSFYDAIVVTVNQKADFVVIPVENSLAGSVIPAYDELINSNLQVRAEIILKIEHCLMGLPNVDVTKIESVISHPQALSQCSNNLKKLKLEPQVFVDTAGAAKYIFEKNKSNHLAIASKLAAETYGLEIIKDAFEDEHFNYTLFLVMGREEFAQDSAKSKKTTIIFSVKDEANALVNILSIFGEHQINLTKIESRPSRDRAWDYLFFIDFEGDEDDEIVQVALLQILKKSTFLKVLGSYQSHQFG